MHAIDPTDPRPPYRQIAASIRQAILEGELEPGSPLPTGQQLAKFFGVSRMTVQTAIRVLRDEGLLHSRSGSGVYVCEKAEPPPPDDNEPPLLTGAATFLYEMGHLKHTPRAGWLLLGIPQPESVAEHSFRAGIVGIVLAALEDADVARTAALCLLHDAHETRIGDVTSVSRAYVETATPEAVSARQTAALPAGAANVFRDLVAEFEGEDTLESTIAHDADKLEMLLQALEYQAEGRDTSAWRESAVAALRTESAKQLARAVTSTHPQQWFSAFAASYRESHADAGEPGSR